MTTRSIIYNYYL